MLRQATSHQRSIQPVVIHCIGSHPEVHQEQVQVSSSPPGAERTSTGRRQVPSPCFEGADGPHQAAALSQDDTSCWPWGFKVCVILCSCLSVWKHIDYDDTQQSCSDHDNAAELDSQGMIRQVSNLHWYTELLEVSLHPCLYMPSSWGARMCWGMTCSGLSHSAPINHRCSCFYGTRIFRPYTKSLHGEKVARYSLIVQWTHDNLQLSRHNPTLEATSLACVCPSQCSHGPREWACDDTFWSRQRQYTLVVESYLLLLLASLGGCSGMCLQHTFFLPGQTANRLNIVSLSM